MELFLAVVFGFLAGFVGGQWFTRRQNGNPGTQRGGGNAEE